MSCWGIQVSKCILSGISICSGNRSLEPFQITLKGNSLKAPNNARSLSSDNVSITNTDPIVKHTTPFLSVVRTLSKYCNISNLHMISTAIPTLSTSLTLWDFCICKPATSTTFGTNGLTLLTLKWVLTNCKLVLYCNTFKSGRFLPKNCLAKTFEGLTL